MFSENGGGRLMSTRHFYLTIITSRTRLLDKEPPVTDNIYSELIVTRSFSRKGKESGDDCD